MRLVKFNLIACSLFFFLALAVSPNATQQAHARSWDPQPTALAQDYLIIQHDKGNGEIIMILWLADPMVDPNAPAAEEVREIFRLFPAIGFAHVQVNNVGQFTDVAGTPVFLNGNGDTLQPIPDSQLPPTAIGAMVAMRNVFTQNLGVLGQQMRWYTIPPNGVSACEPGQLIVSYGSENYDYQTPVPGC